MDVPIGANKIVLIMKYKGTVFSTDVFAADYETLCLQTSLRLVIVSHEFSLAHC